METELPGLLVAGEAVRRRQRRQSSLGDAITEALVFGRRAGRRSAERKAGKQQSHVRGKRRGTQATLDLDRRRLRGARRHQHRRDDAALQTTMADDVGPLRHEEKLERALVAT